MKMTELAWLFSFALNTKKSYQIRQKLQVSWFCFMAFLKNVWLFWTKILRIIMFLFWFEEFYELAEGKTEIIWWTWQKKMDLYIPWRSQSQIKVLLDIQRSQGRNSDLQEKQILQNVI